MMTMTTEARISTGYQARPLQNRLHHALKRFNVIVAHRRFGKTVFALNHIIHKAIRNERIMPRYAYIAPTFGQAKRIAWDYLKMYTAAFPGVTSNEQELRVDIPRTKTDTIRISLLGAEDPVRLKGAYYDDVVFDEYAEMDPKVYSEAIRPALSDRVGGAIFIGTPKGKNNFYDIHKFASEDTTGEWYANLFKASETGIIPPEELAAARREMSSEEYDQEFECSFFGSNVGSYYAAEMAFLAKENRIGRVPYDSAVPVQTAWDLGISDYMAVWFYQRVFKEIHFINYLQVEGMGFPELAKMLKEKPYLYGAHFMPHDAAARELGTGKSRQETAQALGIKPVVIAPKLTVQDGIDATRSLIKRSWFDQDKCAEGLDCLREYRKQWDAKNGVFRPTPVHNEYSHGADAIRTGAVTLDMHREVDKTLPRKAKTDYDIFGGSRR